MELPLLSSETTKWTVMLYIERALGLEKHRTWGFDLEWLFPRSEWMDLMANVRTPHRTTLMWRETRYQSP